ncbi:3D domain-containing protein [Exiguobacterium aurantiacum]|uniref:Cell wall-binding protein yocH n=1 Tax=Exiguobacterium aurantiacum TaxID=33987 RepID=A0A377FU46_9BACL|nr:3D domain-containing protein [Exiguobacterium aurantiacum]STO08337.1 Cell wall-binding protein yocH precursor [Exiguobacterium aurantiacum]
MKQLIKYMLTVLFAIAGALVVTTTADAAQIGIGTEQKIVQNPLELERQAIELAAEQKRLAEQERLAEEKRIAEAKRLAEETARQEAERKAEAEAKRLAELEAKRKAEEAEAARLADEQAQGAERRAEEAPVAQPMATKSTGRVIQVESTAYTNDAADNGTYGGRVLTATGHDVTDSIFYNGMRIIAVDPTIIPLGSKVHLEGIGDAIALDTGGRIKGNIVDLLVDTKQEAIQWGRRHIQVTVY